ncbi:hypothetical protein DSM112329_05178 [Paraconexibacter sp. AEG42_29]|uniref:Uncharacterized protein n=1 Tax=Paraconexibacter sp. AEG42_29 TaxID=2997339 RepID=A0AAU7B333_9ACTN
MPRRFATLIAAFMVLLTALAVAPVSGGAAAKKAKPNRLLWATVNVCDTADHPDTIGIRGSMPGNGIRKQEMYMRFQLQYLSAEDKKWHNIGDAGDSGWIDVGSAKYQRRQTGRNFTVVPPQTGSFKLRGAVTFEWREGTEVVKRARMSTSGKRGSTAGADPSGFSAATCSVTK